MMPSQDAGRPTMNDVAADAGVSLKTVSRVVNNVTTVDSALAERVSASIRKLGFRRNGVAASLRAGGPTRTIGLITADLSNSFYMALASAVAAAARARGFQVIMASSEEDPEIERGLVLDLCQRRVSGLIIVPTGADHRYLREEMELGVCVVFVDRPGSGIAADQIMLDNRGGARAAIEYLVEAGHRRIDLVMDSLSIYTMRERYAGARDALAAAGISEDSSLLAEEVHTPGEAAHAVRAMLERAEPPTAVLCGNNRATIGAVQALWRANTNIELVGFDDFEMAGLLPMPVTVVDYDTAAMGTRAAERLFERIDGTAAATVTQLLPTRLVARGGSWLDRAAAQARATAPAQATAIAGSGDLDH